MFAISGSLEDWTTLSSDRVFFGDDGFVSVLDAFRFSGDDSLAGVKTSIKTMMNQCGDVNKS